jgi:hypothetical protein
MAVESLTSDVDIDLRDEYRSRVFERWTTEEIRPEAGLTGGRLHEPPGLGLPVLLVPAYALAGATGAQLFIAALLALGFVAAAALGRRLVPDPWATIAAIVAGLSPPVLAWSTAVTPDPVAAAAVAGAALFTLSVRDAPKFGRAVLAGVLIGFLPWLSIKFLPVAVLCAAALARWLRRRRRGLIGIAALEIVLVPTVALISVNERLYGGLTPYAAVPGSPTGASTARDYAERIPRLVELLLSPQIGLLVWAPFGVLAFLALELLARSLRERLAVALPTMVDIEVTAGFLASICGVTLAVAAFGVPMVEGPFFPGRDLLPAVAAGAALCAWGLRHAPRIGGALAAVTVGAGIWLVAAGHLGGAGLAPPSGPLPWAGAETVVCAAVAATLVFLLARELWRERELTPGARR